MAVTICGHCGTYQSDNHPCECQRFKMRMEALPNTASLEKRVEELEKTVKELERKLEAFTKYFKHQLDMSKPLIMK